MKRNFFSSVTKYQNKRYNWEKAVFGIERFTKLIIVYVSLNFDYSARKTNYWVVLWGGSAKNYCSLRLAEQNTSVSGNSDYSLAIAFSRLASGGIVNAHSSSHLAFSPHIDLWTADYVSKIWTIKKQVAQRLPSPNTKDLISGREFSSTTHRSFVFQCRRSNRMSFDLSGYF